MEIFVLRDGQQTGPFNEDTVQTLFQRGSLTAVDMAWRKGLPTWMPLGEVLNPGSERPSAPPPTPLSSGIRPAPRKGASAKQKALLKYIGATFEDDITKEEAALALSDALENPKLASRFQKWAEEKLRLHPDIFQDEIDQRRAHRVLRYLELCQTEAAEMVSGVTKAHVQVLVESLDKKNSTWERETRTALWDHLLPSIAEHFPQLVRDGWKSKLKAGSPSKVAASIAADELPEEPAAAPGPFSAALRGLVYGGIVLVLIVGGLQLFKHSENAPAKDSAKSGTPTAPGTPATNPPGAPGAPANPAAAPAIAANPAEIPAAAPGINAEANAAVPDAVPGVAAIPAIPPAPAPGTVTPAPTDPTMAAAGTTPPAAPANPGIPLNTPPAPAPPAVDPPAPAPAPAAATNPIPGTPPEATPATPAAPSGVKNLLTITKPVQVQLQFGKVTLNAGTRVRFIALEGGNVRVNFNNNVILVPAPATDVDPNALPPAPAAPQLPPPPALAQPKPATPATPAVPKPSSDL